MEVLVSDLVFTYDQEKDSIIRAERGVGFEDVITSIKEGRLFAFTDHTQEKYHHQKIFIVGINDYAYVCPCVIQDNTCFLKTLYPCRKYKDYL